MYYERKHISFFSAPICCRGFTARVRETRKPLNDGFGTLNLGQFCAVIVAEYLTKTNHLYTSIRYILLNHKNGETK